MIGVYDSGFGGLTVLRALRRALPDKGFVYLGDSGRAPYGGRDAQTILDFAEQCVERLFEEGCRLVVVACHTVSCVGLRHLQQRYGPERRVLGVTIPGAELAVATSAGRVGIVATQRTVSSRTWVTEIGKLGAHEVVQVAAPLLAPIVEEGWEDTEIARLAVERYVAPLRGCDTVVLGCTHYPLLRPQFERALPGVRVLDPAPFVAERLVDWLVRHPSFDDEGPPAAPLRVLCSGDAAAFRRHGERFLGGALPDVERVAEVDGRLAHHVPRVEEGQVVRGARERR